MQRITEKIKYKLQPLYGWALQKSKAIVQIFRAQYEQVKEYYKTHPKARKWTIVLSVVLGPPFLFLFVIWIEIPSKRALRDIQNEVASEVYSADSVLLGRYYIQDRTEIKYEDISPVVLDALIATEDVRFYEHHGIDYESLGRVLVKSIFLQDESAGGGSTITQQLSKNLYPRKHYWVLSMPINKMREVITALRLESIYPKKDLITLYLNTIPFADQTFGIEAAAKRFFSTTAKELNAQQASLLIGMLKATHSYNPRLFPDRAKKRRNVVLGKMAKYKFITPAASDSLQKLPLKLVYSRISFHQGLAPYFREYLKTELINWCRDNVKEDGTPYNLYTDGLKIYTTIDSRMQAYAEKALTQQMEIVQKQFFDHWGKDKPWKGKEGIVQDAIRRSPRYANLKEQGLPEEKILNTLQKKIPIRIFTWDGEKDVVMSPIDSIKHHLQYLNAGFLAMEPKSGMVKAWVGGIEHDFFQFDHVKESTKRQVGSIFKPIVYAMAIETGAAPCELISAERKTYIDKEGEKWTPRNSQNDYQVKYSMRGALAYSVNTVAVKLIEQAGVENTIALARDMGIVSEMPEVPSIALGSPSISLMEMTTAYSCIDNEGIPSTPYYISAIHDLNGKVYDFKPSAPKKRALSKETALLLTHMLQTVVHEGTASRLRWKYGVYDDVAGKTGTTQSNADGWFMAMTPGLVLGAWVGADDPRIRFRNTELGQGSNTALPIVAFFMKQLDQDAAFRNMTQAKFSPLPNDLQQKLSCDLYELDSTLITQIRKTIYQRDSLVAADTSIIPRDDSFLEKLYKRKLKMMKVNIPEDSVVNEDVQELGKIGG